MDSRQSKPATDASESAPLCPKNTPQEDPIEIIKDSGPPSKTSPPIPNSAPSGRAHGDPKPPHSPTGESHHPRAPHHDGPTDEYSDPPSPGPGDTDVIGKDGQVDPKGKGNCAISRTQDPRKEESSDQDLITCASRGTHKEKKVDVSSPLAEDYPRPCVKAPGAGSQVDGESCCDGPGDDSDDGKKNSDKRRGGSDGKTSEQTKTLGCSKYTCPRSGASDTAPKTDGKAEPEKGDGEVADRA